MSEVQKHGFDFEKWVRDTFFNAYEGKYTQEFDIPPDKTGNLPAPFSGLPVSIKSKKFPNAIELADVIRQRSISTDFVLIVGFWKQHSSTEKWIVEIEPVLVTTTIWTQLWGELTLDVIKHLDDIVKNRSLTYQEARKQAQEFKKTPPFHTSQIVINPKIDSKTQRRVQCSLPYDKFWNLTPRAPVPQAQPKLWNVQFPNPIYSGPRVFL